MTTMWGMEVKSCSRGRAIIGGTILTAVAACGGGAGGDDAADASDAPPVFAATDSARLLGPGIISTAAPEFGATVGPDGTLYFNRASADRGELSILSSRFVDGRWSEPEVVEFSGEHRDIDPFVTPDGRFLYFASDRPLVEGDTTGDFNVWRTQRAEGPADGWSAPVALGEAVNSDASETFLSLDRDGTLYVASDRDGTRRTWVGRPTDSGFGFGPLAPLDLPLNRSEGIGNPLIDPAGTRLVFPASEADGSVGLFVACRTDGGWTEPTNLGHRVNTSWVEFAPGWSPDGRHLLFTSERPGVVGEIEEGTRRPGDLYYVAWDTLGIEACPGG